MKKLITLLVLSTLLISTLAGCNKDTTEENPNPTENPVSILQYITVTDKTEFEQGKVIPVTDIVSIDASVSAEVQDVKICTINNTWHTELPTVSAGENTVQIYVQALGTTEIIDFKYTVIEGKTYTLSDTLKESIISGTGWKDYTITTTETGNTKKMVDSSMPIAVHGDIELWGIESMVQVDNGSYHMYPNKDTWSVALLKPDLLAELDAEGTNPLNSYVGLTMLKAMIGMATELAEPPSIEDYPEGSEMAVTEIPLANGDVYTVWTITEPDGAKTSIKMNMPSEENKIIRDNTTKYLTEFFDNNYTIKQVETEYALFDKNLKPYPINKVILEENLTSVNGKVNTFPTLYFTKLDDGSYLVFGFQQSIDFVNYERVKKELDDYVAAEYLGNKLYLSACHTPEEMDAPKAMMQRLYDEYKDSALNYWTQEEYDSYYNNLSLDSISLEELPHSTKQYIALVIGNLIGSPDPYELYVPQENSERDWAAEYEYALTDAYSALGDYVDTIQEWVDYWQINDWASSDARLLWATSEEVVNAFLSGNYDVDVYPEKMDSMEDFYKYFATELSKENMDSYLDSNSVYNTEYYAKSEEVFFNNIILSTRADMQAKLSGTTSEDTPTTEEEVYTPEVKPTYAERYPTIYTWPNNTTKYRRWIYMITEDTDFVGTITLPTGEVYKGEGTLNVPQDPIDNNDGMNMEGVQSTPSSYVPMSSDKNLSDLGIGVENKHVDTFEYTGSTTGIKVTNSTINNMTFVGEKSSPTILTTTFNNNIFYFETASAKQVIEYMTSSLYDTQKFKNGKFVVKEDPLVVKTDAGVITNYTIRYTDLNNYEIERPYMSVYKVGKEYIVAYAQKMETQQYIFSELLKQMIK